MSKQKLKMNSKEQEMGNLKERIRAKEILLQKRDDLTNKINLLIEKLNS